MYIPKLKGILVVIVLSTILGVVSIGALLQAIYNIPTSGFIGGLGTPSLGENSSEIRAVFVKNAAIEGANWDIIMSTLQAYNINVVIAEMLGNNYALYPSAYIQHSINDNLAPAVEAAHARNMSLYVSFNVLLSTPGDEYRAEDSSGNLVGWLDPTKQISRTHMKNLVEELVTNYDIDGVMFDYARYPSADVTYSLEAKAKLEGYLGETITTWPGDFAPGGARYNEFMEWRPMPINELIRDMINWMKAIKPNMKFTACPLGWLPGWATYSRYWYAQDSTYWVKEGYLDWLAPQEYAENTDTIRDRFVDMVDSGVGGPEGKIPMVAFIAVYYPHGEPYTPYAQDFLQRAVDVIRQIGLDGWVVFSYGGPGITSDYPPIDIRTYLNLTSLPPTFDLKYINVSSTLDSATITWTTNLPATSKVEYSTSPLFTASLVYHPGANFDYWDIDHALGTIIENTTLVTDHRITLTGLQAGTTYFYRVQSQDTSGVATSKVYTFEL